MELREQEHNYELVETEDGFEIIPIEKHREPVRARLLQNGFWTIESSYINKDNREWIFTDFSKQKNVIKNYIPGDSVPDEFFPLFCFSPLLNKMVSILYITWSKIGKISELEKKYNECLGEIEPDAGIYSSMSQCQIIHKWAIKQTVKTLSKKASIIAKEKHNILDPDVVKVHKLMYSEAGGAGGWGNLFDLLKDTQKSKYLVKDLIHFRAARCLLLTESYVTDEWSNISLQTVDWENFQWKNEIASTEKFFVRKTISNYPKNTPYHAIEIFHNLDVGYLSEPITSRIRFMAYDALSKSRASVNENYYKVIKNSTDDEIKKAVRMYYDDNNEKCDLRKYKICQWVFSYMFDYIAKSDKVANINMIGLYKRAKQYHAELEREMQENRRRYELDWLLRNEDRKAKEAEFLKAKSKIPPIELPTNEHVHFLENVKEIKDEGELMHHCVGGYSEDAVKGRSYLFHIDYKGELATAEVNAYGNVVQVRGPHNKENSATKYGERILREWGKKFKDTVKIITDSVPQPCEYVYEEDVPL